MTAPNESALRMLAPSSLSGCIEVDDAPWPAAVPIPTAVSGNPVAETLSIVDGVEFTAGLWRCTPGTYLSDHAGYIEFLHVLGGAADLRGDDGVVWHLRAGTSLVIPDGWTGTWTVTETVVKTFAIYRHAASPDETKRN